MTRGAFIVVEGLDRSGKSTQTAALYDRLAREGKSVKLYKFPGGCAGQSYMPVAFLIVGTSCRQDHGYWEND